MSDSLTAGNALFKRTIGDKEVSFHLLSFYDRAALANEFRKRRRDEKAALLKETTADLLAEHPVEVAQMKHDQLADFDAKYTGDLVWFDFFNSDDGKLAILKKSLENGDVPSAEAEKLAKRYAGDDVAQLCAAVTYTPIMSRKDADANPRKPNAEEKSKAFGEE